MTAVQLSKSGIFFDAAKSGLSFENLTAADFAFLDAWFNDCDGCLLDSESPAMGDLGRKIDEALKAAGHAPGLNDPDFVASFAGWHADEIIKHIAAQAGVTLDRDAIFAAHKVSVIDTLKREVTTFEGMDNVLALMKAGAKDKMAVITSSEYVRVHPGLEKTGIIKHFIDGDITHIYSAPDICPANKKPDPHIYLHGGEVFGVAMGRTGTIEDSTSGVKSAVAAGVGYVIGFVGGSHYPHNRKDEFAQKLLDAGAHVVIRDIRELPLAVLALHNSRGPQPALVPAGAAPSLDA